MLVTVRGKANQYCPVLPPTVRKIHWPLEDPAKARGSEADTMTVFRASRDDIRNRVQSLATELVGLSNKTRSEI